MIKVWCFNCGVIGSCATSKEADWILAEHKCSEPSRWFQPYAPKENYEIQETIK